MEFIMLTIYAVLICLVLMGIAVLAPRHYYRKSLKDQLKKYGGHIFTPDTRTWQSYLARTVTPLPMLSAVAYAGLLGLLSFTGANDMVVATVIGLGCYLLIRHLLYMVPPTFGVTDKGVTVLSWLPNYPMGPYGSGSIHIPWRSVEICAINTLFFTILTGKSEARVVYPPELEEKICEFVDSLLQKQGYRVDTSKA